MKNQEHYLILCDSSYLDGTRKRKVTIYGTETDVSNFVFPYALEDDDPRDFSFESEGEMLAFLQLCKRDVLFDAATGKRMGFTKNVLVESNKPAHGEVVQK